MSETTPVNVHILDRDYLVACTEDERDDLLAAASYLNAKMKEIRDSGKVVGVDRIAVMAALNISHELLRQKSQGDDFGKTLSSRLQALQQKIELALSEGNQMEL
jgi:cell division protein ZapA